MSEFTYIKASNVIIRAAKESDLEFVINAEREADNAKYVGQWSKEQHLNALSNKDILHLIVEDISTKKPIGYLIIAGLENHNKCIEFRRFVITDKGRGLGRECLKVIKKLAFDKLKAHRLWLDVRSENRSAQKLYKSEGFIEEGILRECILHDGKYESLIVMSILKDEYEKFD